MDVPRVALVVPGLVHGGGVPAVGHFLHRVLEDSGRFRSEFISLPMSSRDRSSVRLRAPWTWWRGIRVEVGSSEGQRYRQVGAFLAEFEFQRYRPRRVLTEMLDEYDLVQIVAGTPSWAMTARDVVPPVALQVATLVQVERREALSRPGLHALWLSLMTEITSKIDAAAVKHVDAVFVENRWMFDHMKTHLEPSRVIFAPPGVDTDLYRPDDAPPPKTGPILSVGRFADPRKNVRLLFEAYHRLRQEVPDAPGLVLAGQRGPTAQDRSFARSLGIADHVDVREGLPEADLVELYRKAALFVLSSDEEGLGIVILEAMACGLPVVSTDCGGPGTAVVDGTTGFLVPVGDPGALAARMGDVLADPERARELGRNARKRAVERFSLTATGRLFLDCYDRLLGRA